MIDRYSSDPRHRSWDSLLTYNLQKGKYFKIPKYLEVILFSKPIDMLNSIFQVCVYDVFTMEGIS